MIQKEQNTITYQKGYDKCKESILRIIEEDEILYKSEKERLKKKITRQWKHKY